MHNLLLFALIVIDYKSMPRANHLPSMCSHSFFDEKISNKFELIQRRRKLKRKKRKAGNASPGDCAVKTDEKRRPKTAFLNPAVKETYGCNPEI
jgi:hypothetical protein